MTKTRKNETRMDAGVKASAEKNAAGDIQPGALRQLAEIFFAAAKAGTGDWETAEAVLCGTDLPALLAALDWLKPDALLVCSLRSFPDCRRLAKDGQLKPADPRVNTWGMAWNGWALTQPVREMKGVDAACSLEQILVPDAPERYFLPLKQMEKLLYRAKTDTTGMSIVAEDSLGDDAQAGEADVWQEDEARAA